MNQHIDPRSLGFSYGSPLATPASSALDIATAVCFVLGRIAGEIDRQAHELEMAIKDVRIATNRKERELAMRDLEEVLSEHVPHDLNE